MKNIAVVLISILVFLSGCSWIYRFTVYNKTDQKLTVKHRLTSVAEAGVFKKNVSVLTIKGRQKNKVSYCKYDEVLQTVKFGLEPNQLAVIGLARNTSYTYFRKYLYESDSQYANRSFFNLDNLEFISQKGAIMCWGELIETLITKNRTVETRIEISKLQSQQLAIR